MNGHHVKVGMRVCAVALDEGDLGGVVVEVQPSVAGAMPLWAMVTFDGDGEPFRMSVERLKPEAAGPPNSVAEKKDCQK